MNYLKILSLLITTFILLSCKSSNEADSSSVNVDNSTDQRISEVIVELSDGTIIEKDIYKYDAQGFLTSISEQSSGDSTTFTYDDNKKLKKSSVRVGRTIYEASFNYADNDEKVLSVDFYNQDGEGNEEFKNHTFQYDDLNVLVSAISNDEDSEKISLEYTLNKNIAGYKKSDSSVSYGYKDKGEYSTSRIEYSNGSIYKEVSSLDYDGKLSTIENYSSDLADGQYDFREIIVYENGPCKSIFVNNAWYMMNKSIKEWKLCS